MKNSTNKELGNFQRGDKIRLNLKAMYDCWGSQKDKMLLFSNGYYISADRDTDGEEHFSLRNAIENCHEKVVIAEGGKVVARIVRITDAAVKVYVPGNIRGKADEVYICFPKWIFTDSGCPTNFIERLED